MSREHVVDWIINIIIQFDSHICLRTAYFAVALVDNFFAVSLSQSTTGKHHRSITWLTDNITLIGATCFHIASKCEDVSYIGIQELAEITHLM